MPTSIGNINIALEQLYKGIKIRDLVLPKIDPVDIKDITEYRFTELINELE